MERSNATAFALGIDYERARYGLIAEMPADIEVEREALDRGLSIRGRPPAEAEPLIEHRRVA